jgi:hypothetical protein
MDLTSVSFYVDPYALSFGSHSLTTPVFSISLSTTSKTVGGLDLNFSNNLGADNTTVFSGIISVSNVTAGQPIILSFVNPFPYDPASGNLLLSIYADTGFTTQNTTAGSLFLESEDPSTISSRLTSTIFGTGEDNSALVTSFSYTNVGVPAPIAGAGLPGVAFVLGVMSLVGWRRKRKALSTT